MSDKSHTRYIPETLQTQMKVFGRDSHSGSGKLTPKIPNFSIFFPSGSKNILSDLVKKYFGQPDL